MRRNSLVSSRAKMFLFSFMASLLVLGTSLLIQWLIYDDWLHRTGVRVVGTSIATLVTFIFVLRWQHMVHEKQLEMVRRLEMISYMNDRIRNALQAIECVTYLSQPEATAPVRQAVDSIDEVLRDVLAAAGHPLVQPGLPPVQSRKKSA